MVEDVYEELERLSAALPPLAALLKDWPPNPVRRLDISLKAEAAAAIKATHLPGDHPRTDAGEVATVLYAARQRELGETFDVLTDDGLGKALARDRGLTLVTSPGLVIEMVRASALEAKDGRRVWQQCLPRKRWREFDDAVADHMRIRR